MAVHISHFNSRADLVLPMLDAGRRQGIDVTFDLYCYLAGSTILGMIALPPWVQEGGIDATWPGCATRRAGSSCATGSPARAMPLETIAAQLRRRTRTSGSSKGKTLPRRRHASRASAVGDFVCDLLVASDMAVGCVVPHRSAARRTCAPLMRHPAMMAGSDGIYTGSHPHPRGCGCFARYLGHYVRDGRLDAGEAVQHLVAHAARRFGLKDRGLIREGMAADIVVFDPDTIADRSTYDDGTRPGGRHGHVLVNGELRAARGPADGGAAGPRPGPRPRLVAMEWWQGRAVP